MKKSRFPILLLVLIATSVGYLPAQPVNNVVKAIVMATPTAASLGKYGDIPVNLSTGVPDISVPITTIQEGPVSMDVSISYHASGIKIAEPASWVGLGWALNAGGAISRTVQALPDEGGTGMLGYYSDVTPVPYPMTGPQIDDYTSSKDPEPDIFSFNVGGYTGKFYFNKDRTITLVPKQDLRVSVNFTNGKFYWFLIVTPDGTKYYFGAMPSDGGTNTAREESTADDPTALSTSSWYLRRIESQDGLYAIVLNYKDESYSFKSPASCEQKYVACAANGGGSFATSWNCSYNSADVYHYYNSILTRGKRLFSISTATSSVTFDTTTAYRTDLEPYLPGQTNGSRSLDKITVRQGTTACSEFRFTYDYFTDPAHNTPEGRRLRLLNVKEVSCDGTIEKAPYVFTYQGFIIRWRLSHSVDHWGFYNGANNEGQTINVPPTTVYAGGSAFTFGNSSRESVESQMMDGMLTKIDYPTGGNTQFSYEGNDYPTTETSTYRKYSVQVSNCTYPQACCGTQTIDSFHTFTADELSGARYLFDLKNPTCSNGNFPACTPEYPMTATLEVYQGTTLVHTPIVLTIYNTNPITCSDTIGGYLNTLLNTLQPGVLYKFRMTGTNSKATFQIYKYATFTAYISQKVGGLRIAQIKSSDGVNTANDIIKTYQYKNTTNASSGILFYKPTYAYGFTTAGTAVALFRDNSIIPMSGFENYHIGYTRVTELLNGNGKIVHDFNIEYMTGTAASFPVVPEPARLQNGFETSTLQVAQDGTVVLSATNALYNDSYEVSSGGTNNRLKIINIPVGNCSGTFALKVSSFPYGMRTRFVRPGSVTTIMDGVSSTTTNEYDASLSYAGATKQTTVNSDNVSTVTEMKYAWTTGYSSPNSLVATIDSLKRRNIIGMPLETNIKVNNVQVDGSRTDYGLYRALDGIRVTAVTPAVHVYPYLYSRYEATFDASGNVVLAANPWEPQDEISQYYGTNTPAGQGYPYVWTKTHWPSETYEWETSGRLKKRTYQTFVKEYTWFPGTRLLQQSKDIDAQLINYTYDQLSRLSTVSTRGGNVLTTYTYQYKVGTTPAYVKALTNYTPVAGSTLNIQEMFQYVDGLGRSIQTIGKKQSPAQKDVVSVTEYDKWGRVSKTYNPFEATTNTGAYATSIPGGTPFTLTEYNSDPLNRTWKTTPPSWYATTYQYGTNAGSEVKLNHAANTYYTANTLRKTTITDPDGKQIISFKDLKDRDILVKRTDGISSAETYKQYDDKDRLKLVIPPGSVYNSTALNFAYTYDGANNMVTKKVPDAALVNIKYNERDQLALEQDGNLSGLNKWRCSQYDAYGRLIKSGLFSGVVPNPILTTLAPTDLYIENLYDGSGTLPIEKGRLTKARVKEFDGSGTWLETSLTYDSYGRITKTTGSNHLLPADLTSEKSDFTYDYADHLLTDTRLSKKTASITTSVTQTHDYDHWGRLKSNKHQVNGGTVVVTSDLNYDWKDQLIERNLGKTPSSSYLQSLDYTYNDQGWLQMINTPMIASSAVALTTCPTNPATPNPAASPTVELNDLFYFELKYDVLQSGLPGTLQKNGNISQAIWRTRGRERQSYSVAYDFLNRMTTATYADITDAGVANSSDRFQEKVNTYDSRGNIQSLQRNGLYKTTPTATCWTAGQIDNLSYTYYSGSNRLQKITDSAPAASKASGWNNITGASATASYLYDANGNLTFDPYKSSSNLYSGASIQYNFLNLPTQLTWSNSGGGEQIIYFLYDGTGRKLRKTVMDNATLVYKQDYVNGIEYRTTPSVALSLESVEHSDGRVFNTNVGTASADALRYEYSIKDHLGSVRLTFTDKNANGVIEVTNTAANEVLQENQYYPFGLSMSGPWMDDAAVMNNQYLYNAKELNNDFNLSAYDYGARWYDPAVGRWWSVDPMAEKYRSCSPYIYTKNNPLKFIDPDGKQIIIGYSKDMSEEDRRRYNEAILAILRKLTDDNLSIVDGKVVIDKENNGKKKAGTSLIRGFVKGFVRDDKLLQRDVTIVKDSDNPVMKNATTVVDPNVLNQKDASNGVGADSKIKYDPESAEGTGYYKDGDTKKQIGTPEMILVHELIHAFRIAYGKRNTSSCTNCKREITKEEATVQEIVRDTFSKENDNIPKSENPRRE